MIAAFAPALGRSIEWPSPPAMYSYSSIADIGRCPRRWALRNANYPDVWDGYGYPPRPGYGTIRGLALHRAMELLADAAAGIADGVHDLREPAIRHCGGYTELLRRALADVWKALQRNPRLTPYLDQWQLRVEQDIGGLRHLLQKLVAQTPLPASAPVTAPYAASRGRHALPNGVYQEIAVQSQPLRLKGKIDLLIISEDRDIVIDFKTGEPDPGHKTQLELYALLWSEDERNGKQTAPELRIVYPGHETNWDPPDLATLQAAASSVAATVTENDGLLTANPPPARPSAENCGYCDVRHLCEDYWNQNAWKDHEPFLPGSAIDLEVQIAELYSAKSFGFTTLKCVPPVRGIGSRLQTTGRTQLSSGDRLRLLGCRVRDDDPDEVAVVAGAGTEVIRLQTSGV